MKTGILLLFGVIGLGLVSCATHVSKSKRQQVELATQTGPYSYLRAAPGGSPGR